ncbi:MAG: hypothetical protein M1301_01040 [Candidatus Thermoplasmatota archaeon]|jgi:hypothetical protein|nr:hypothetical protein [Candidatus Thermoplasmatota archaeon]
MASLSQIGIIEVLSYVSSTSQLSGALSRLLEVVVSISAVVVALLWIPIALSFFSTDENKRFEARGRLKNALIGTLIYVLAISGVIYAVFNYVAIG